MLPFSNSPRNETKARSSKEVAGAHISDRAFLTWSKVAHTAPMSHKKSHRPHGVVVVVVVGMLCRLLRVTAAGGDTIPDEASDTNGTWSRKEEGGGREAQPMHISCSTQRRG